MAGIKPLKKIQLGRQSSETIVAATTVWRGTGSLRDEREPVFPAEDIGYLSGTSRSYIPKIGAGIDLESVEATFEQFPHLLEMSIKTVTPTQDGTGSGYIYQYDFPTTAAPTIKPYTVEGGDNQQAEVMDYAHCAEWTLEGNKGEAWMKSGNLVGRQIANQAFTASVAVPTVEEMLFQRTKLYIDAIAGAWGTTLKSNTLLSASLNYKSGIIPKWVADGNLFYSFYQFTQPEVRLSITFEHDGNATAEKDFWRSQTARLLRLKIEGSTFAAAGTTYSVKTCLIDLAGKWVGFEPLGDEDGNNIVEAEFLARYDATGAKFGKVVVVPALSALP